MAMPAKLYVPEFSNYYSGQSLKKIAHWLERYRDYIISNSRGDIVQKSNSPVLVCDLVKIDPYDSICEELGGVAFRLVKRALEANDLVLGMTDDDIKLYRKADEDVSVPGVIRTFCSDVLALSDKDDIVIEFGAGAIPGYECRLLLKKKE